MGLIRCGVTGVPGSGKTSMTRALAADCRRIDGLSRVEAVPEYARRYIAQYGMIEGVWEQMRILEKQVQWEDSVPADQTDILITDSPIFFSFVYCLEMGMKTKKDVMMTNDIFKRINKLNYPPRYDIIFHLPPKIKPVQDGIRNAKNFDDDWRKQMDHKILSCLTVFPPKKLITIESTGIDERVNEAIEHIKEYKSQTPGFYSHPASKINWVDPKSDLLIN